MLADRAMKGDREGAMDGDRDDSGVIGGDRDGMG